MPYDRPRGQFGRVEFVEPVFSGYVASESGGLDSVEASRTSLIQLLRSCKARRVAAGGCRVACQGSPRPVSDSALVPFVDPFVQPAGFFDQHLMCCMNVERHPVWPDYDVNGYLMPPCPCGGDEFTCV